MLKTYDKQAPESALIVKLSSLGDLFHALPAVHALKEAGCKHITWVTQPEYVKLVASFPEVDEAIAFPRQKFCRHLPAFKKALRRRNYDLVIDLQGLLKSALAGWLAHGQQFVGPSYHREKAHWFYHSVAGELNKQRHAVDEIMEIVATLGLPAKTTVFPTAFPKWERIGDSPQIALVPRSRWETKNWTASGFAATAELLAKDFPTATFCVVGGPGDRDIGQEIIDGAPLAQIVNRCGDTGLGELGGLLEAMDLVITVDSGPMHMAAATGTPTIALFGPTHALRTGPYGSNHTVITAGDCPRCFERSCHRGDMHCMNSITPAMVADAAKKALSHDY